MRFVDANVFIYVLAKSPKEDYLVSKSVLKRVEDGEEAITSTAIIREVVDWLEYNNRRDEVEKFLTALNSYTTMMKVEVSWRETLHAPSDMEKYNLDFVDAITLQAMKKNKVAQELGEHVKTIFRQADSMRKNFYENLATREDVEDVAKEVAKLVKDIAVAIKKNM